jgi:hypothetical protein
MRAQMTDLMAKRRGLKTGQFLSGLFPLISTTFIISAIMCFAAHNASCYPFRSFTRPLFDIVSIYDETPLRNVGTFAAENISISCIPINVLYLRDFKLETPFRHFYESTPADFLSLSGAEDKSFLFIGTKFVISSKVSFWPAKRTSNIHCIASSALYMCMEVNGGSISSVFETNVGKPQGIFVVWRKSIYINSCDFHERTLNAAKRLPIDLIGLQCSVGHLFCHGIGCNSSIGRPTRRICESARFHDRLSSLFGNVISGSDRTLVLSRGSLHFSQLTLHGRGLITHEAKLSVHGGVATFPRGFHLSQLLIKDNVLRYANTDGRDCQQSDKPSGSRATPCRPIGGTLMLFFGAALLKVVLDSTDAPHNPAWLIGCAWGIGAVAAFLIGQGIILLMTGQWLL